MIQASPNYSVAKTLKNEHCLGTVIINNTPAWGWMRQYWPQVQQLAPLPKGLLNICTLWVCFLLYILGGDEDAYTLPWWRQLIWSILFVAMATTATCGNLIVIWIVMWHQRMRTVTNYFIGKQSSSLSHIQMPKIQSWSIRSLLNIRSINWIIETLMLYNKVSNNHFASTP